MNEYDILAAGYPHRNDVAPRPCFTAHEVAKQKKAGKAILEKIRAAALDFSQSSITVPAGDYGFAIGEFINGVESSAVLADIKRPDDNPFTVYAEGVTFWFDTLGKACPSCSRSLHIMNCANLRIVGLTMDDYLPDDIEGQVTFIDCDNNRLAIKRYPGSKVIDAYAMESVLGSECRIVPLKANGNAVTPTYKIDDSWGPGAFWVSKVEPTGNPDEFWLTFRDTNLFSTIYTETWKRTYGAEGTIEIGDGIALLYGTKFCAVDNSRRIQMISVSMYGTKFGFWENGGYGDHLWKDCYFGPRPGTSQILGAEGCMSQGLRHGSTYDHVMINFTTDDMLNIHAFWCPANEIDGNSILFGMAPCAIEAGDVVEAYDKEGNRIGALTVAADAPAQYDYNGCLTVPVLFTEPIDAKFAAEGVRFRFPANACDGFVVKNGIFKDVYQRLLVQNGSGVIENNLFLHMGSCVEIESDPTYLEGGTLGNVTVRDNIFLDCTTMPKGIVVKCANAECWSGKVHGGELSVEQNLFVGCGLVARTRYMGAFTLRDNLAVNPRVYGADPQTFADLVPESAGIGIETRSDNETVKVGEDILSRIETICTEGKTCVADRIAEVRDLLGKAAVRPSRNATPKPMEVAGNLLCQIGNSSHVQMMGYLIRTEDGKIIAVDGGTWRDVDHFMTVLKTLCGEEFPHVDAWLMTHPHSDHIAVFNRLMTDHADEFTLGKVYYHFASEQFLSKGEPGEAYMIHDFYALLPRFADRSVIVSTGDVYEVGAAKFEVLYVTDPAFTKNVFNNSSTVFRLTLGGKTVLFLGDLGVEAGQKLLAQYGDALKSDYCQMAHHGQSGVTREVYEAIRPENCLWCAPAWLYDNDAGKGYNTHGWQTVIVRGWMDEIGAVNHYVEKDGDIIIKM